MVARPLRQVKTTADLLLALTLTQITADPRLLALAVHPLLRVQALAGNAGWGWIFLRLWRQRWFLGACCIGYVSIKWTTQKEGFLAPFDFDS